MSKFNKIVLNIPHSSINGVFTNGSGWGYNANLLNSVMKETDWHTDFIFNDDREEIVPCIFNYSRFLVDVERLENDPLENEGRGIIYSNVNGHQRECLDKNKREELLALRNNFLDSISKELTDTTLLIDCHSFNNEVAKDVDICIGFNDDWSKPDDDIISGIASIFAAAGYKVKFNKPYSNSITPKSDSLYKSIMIEVNKKLYLRNNSNEINVDTIYAPKLSNTIKKVYDFALS